jgi:hypothetical protein
LYGFRRRQQKSFAAHFGYAATKKRLISRQVLKDRKGGQDKAEAQALLNVELKLSLPYLTRDISLVLIAAVAG